MKLKPEYCFINILDGENITDVLQYNGPYLVNMVLKLFLKDNNELRDIPIKYLNEWQHQLKQINELLWFNSSLTYNWKIVKENYKISKFYYNKLKIEIQFVCKKISENHDIKFANDYLKQIEIFNNFHFDDIDDIIVDDSNDNVNIIEIQTALHYVLMGFMQLHLTTFTPLVDPIEKNSFKKAYFTDDINYLTSISNVYAILSVAMQYKNFANEYRVEITKKLEQLIQKRSKYMQKTLERRPESDIYSKMCQDIQHYLNTNCKPMQLMAILTKATTFLVPADESNYQNEEFSEKQKHLQETIKIIKIWMLNAEQFLYNIHKKYPSYENDLLQPIEIAIMSTCYGFEALIKLLIQYQNLEIFEKNTSLESTNLCTVLKELVKCPNSNILPSKLQNKIFVILENINSDKCEKLNLRLLKSQLIEIHHNTNQVQQFNSKIFLKFNDTINLVNQIWNNQQELKKQQQIKEESLFVIRTRCQDEDENEEALKTIKDIFPTTVEQDFSDYFEINSLEHQSKKSVDPVQDYKKLILNDNEYEFVVEIFINILENYSQTPYYISKNSSNTNIKSLSLNEALLNKLQIFQTIYNVYSSALEETFDSQFYNITRFIIKLHADQINNATNPHSYDSTKAFNIYKDSNIPEITSCVPLLDEIKLRTNEQLNLYPDHAVLLDIINIIKRINNFAINSPIVRFNTGFQLLRQKLSLWNEVAHKGNHMEDLEVQVAGFVQRWTKLELQFWRSCLTEAKDKVEKISYKYWFFLFNMIKEYLNNLNDESEKVNDKPVTPINDESEKVNDKLVTANDVVKMLIQFMDSSNFGDFQIRLKLLKTFEFYLSFLIQHDSTENDKKFKLIAIFYNCRIFYEQFINEIEEHKKQLLTGTEKKLKELVKIESFNKDLSYFSMRNNVARVHRNLNKFIKEYENGLKETITKVFEHKDEIIYDLSGINDKGGKNLRFDPKVKYYMVDSKHFIALQKYKDLQLNFLNDESISSESSLQSSPFMSSNRLEKLFMTSRNVCRDIIIKIDYPNLTSNLEGILSNYFETYEYLRNLNVDRSLEKSKQIQQNKNFIQQKRKALSDVFKTLSILGLNYRTGLTEYSINSEFSNFEITPFSIDILLQQNIITSKTLNQNFSYLNENINLYYAKCTHKMKILQNILLNPNAQLGLPNMERIKGFSVDLFLLVRSQRNHLSNSVNAIYNLGDNITKLIKLVKYSQQNNYDEAKLNFIQLEKEKHKLLDVFNKIIIFAEQLKILMDTLPAEVNAENVVFENCSKLLKNTEKYIEIMKILNNLINVTKKSLKDLKSLNNSEPLNYELINKLSINKNECLEFLNNLKLQLTSTINIEYSPVEKSISSLIHDLNTADNIPLQTTEVDVTRIHTEIENIVHMALITMQNLFKKYTAIDKSENDKHKTNIIGECEIFKNHLKIKISETILNDFKIFQIDKLCEKIENIFISIKHLDFKTDTIRKIGSIIPILHQYNLLGYYYLLQQLAAHKVSVKILYIMLSAFIELTSKGFCSPPDLEQDEDGEQMKKQNTQNEGGGFSEENLMGNEKDVSDQIENEDQLDDAKRPEDRKNDKDENQQECKEEKGIEMSENFDAEMQDLTKQDDEKNEEDSNKSDEEEELDKEMGDTEHGAEKLDDQIWGSDNEENQSDNENEMSDDEYNKGAKDDDETHNDLNAESKTQNDKKTEQNDENLDAIANEEHNQKEKKQNEKDIDEMKEPEYNEEQINPYHNELEEPPEAEDMQLDENVNLDNEDGDKEQKNDGENPFDIDRIKETMDVDDTENDENKENDEELENKENENEVNGDSEEENYDNLNRDKDEKEENIENNEDNIDENDAEKKENDDNLESKGEHEEISETEESKKIEEKLNEIYEESKDKPSKEENIQSNETDEVRGSNDQVKDSENNNIQPDQTLDDQETGDDGKGIGQANDEKADSGHESSAQTRELDTLENNTNENKSKMKNKPQQADENRTLGEKTENTLNTLKTINKNQNNEEERNEKQENQNLNAQEEYQHIKNPEKSEITAIDNATEEQSKQLQHQSDEENVSENEEDNTEEKVEHSELENQENIEKNEKEINELKPEKNNQKSDKSKINDLIEDRLLEEERMEIEGDDISTELPMRAADTTAHSIKENLITNLVQEPTEKETLEMRKLYIEQLGNTDKSLPTTIDFETWQMISTQMQTSARDLCEQLRLILEPTKCTKLKGDYKTGRRINMKKIIPYIASQFRKDKIWLRRTKPSQRDYKITIAIDDSKSMHHNNSKEITLKAISLVSQALTLLESGKLNIVSFGESSKIILNHYDQFDGPKLVNALNFDQNESKIAELLDFIRTMSSEDSNSSSDNRLFENLILILSDGRNIYSEGEQKVKNSVKLAKLQRIFIVYIIIDNPENKHSILDIRVPSFSADKKLISMKSYLDTFPFPYYVIVRDLNQLPLVLSEAMRQWFELVNSEQ